MLPNLALVLGGASSGKSALAERLCESYARPMVYLATAQALDEEMAAKISAHKLSRGPDWHTVEAPLDLCAPLAGVPAESVALVDCVTLWLSNHLLAEHDLEAEESRLMAGLAAAPCPVVLVSNEVGQGVVPESPMGRAFRVAQGRLNRVLAARADTVVGVMAGLPFALKGPLPEALR